MGFLRQLKKLSRPLNIGPYELDSALDAAVHVGLSGEIDDRVEGLSNDVQDLLIHDRAQMEFVPRILLQVLQILYLILLMMVEI